MKKWLVCLGLMAALIQSAWAFRPSGWVYMDYPWAYESATGDWYWFNTPNTQWVVRMSNGQWSRLPNSALASGWSFFNGAYAYAQGNADWHWFNESDVQWVVNMRTAQWSRFGASEAPDGMVLVPFGTNEGTDPEVGAYSLTVTAFYMDATEVSYDQWTVPYDWGTEHGYQFDNAGSTKPGGANLPVQQVNWYDCVKWCNARSQMEGRAPVYYADGAFSEVYKTGRVDLVSMDTTAAGYRLPTVIEWQYAARGGAVGLRFPWGSEIQHALATYFSSTSFVYDTSPTRGYHPSSNTGSPPFVAPVGSFAANGYGLSEMSGNVMEWCQDWDISNVLTRRSVYGGSYVSSAEECSISYGFSYEPLTAENTTGFRCVLQRP